MIFREKGESKEEFLFKLYNKGASDLRICHNYEIDGELMWSKWIRYDHLMELHPGDWVQGTRDSKEKFIKRATHRTTHPCEIVYDVDESVIDSKAQNGKIMLHRYKQYPNIKVHSKAIAVSLIGTHHKIYFTGNKSYHLHQYEPMLSSMNPQGRRDYKERLISLYGTDPQLASENCMIAIEGEPHYRSGKPKAEVVL